MTWPCVPATRPISQLRSARAAPLDERRRQVVVSPYEFSRTQNSMVKPLRSYSARSGAENVSASALKLMAVLALFCSAPAWP
jgi:hypothetical protein